MPNNDALQHLISEVGIFKRLRPKTPEQAARFFYCDFAVVGERCFLSGKSCATRHIKHKAKLESLINSEAMPIEIEMAGVRACGTCEFGEMRAKLLKKRRKKHE